MRNVIAVLIIVLIFPFLVGAVAESDPLTEGIRLFNRGSYEQAIGPLAKAVASKPDDAVARLTYGVALANGRRYAAAIVLDRDLKREADTGLAARDRQPHARPKRGG